jgi:predicted enzyme related to lactoylglutathione lyase
MASGMQTVIYPVKDLESAKKVYTELLGSAPAYETPTYVGWNINGQDIGLDPNGAKQGLTAPVPYWHVDDIKTSLEKLVAAGATVQQQPRDIGGGGLMARVKDADGNITGLLQKP